MAILLIRSATESTRLQVSDGQSVRDILDETDLRVRAACGGVGSCGACVVRLVEGHVSPMTASEFIKIPQHDRLAGIRLACQMRIFGDTEILLDQPAPPSHWKSISPQDLLAITGGRPGLTEHIYGVAVDLGTTHIRISLWDRKHGKRLATRRGQNPQNLFGADVLNRLSTACAQPEKAKELAKLARTAIIQAVRDILARDIGQVTPMLAQIGEVLIVGNTAMHALLTGHGADTLINPEYWQRPVDCQPDNPSAWHADWYMPNAKILLPHSIAGFIGSDLVADMLATGLVNGPPGTLLLDVGTNTEIALWDGEVIHVTSVPGGPAFEEGGIRNGMAAELGAICHVHISGSGFLCDVIGGQQIRGICGSGLVDAIALLLMTGLLKPSGRFAVPISTEGFLLDPNAPPSAICGSDVDGFQRAKAAMAAAMASLLEIAGMTWSDLRRLCVCGAFGRTLNIEHAQAVGLLPQINPALIELHADASLAGCEMALLDASGAMQFDTLTSKTKAINLSTLPSYDDRYIDHLSLRPFIEKQ